MTGGELDRFGWVYDGPLSTTGCVTLVETVGLATVAAGFGTLAGDVRRLPLTEIRRVYAIARLSRCAPSAPWAIAVENNGFEGSRPEVLRRVSVGTRALNVFWSVDATARVSYAVSGDVRTR